MCLKGVVIGKSTVPVFEVCKQGMSECSFPDLEDCLSPKILSQPRSQASFNGCKS